MLRSSRPQPHLSPHPDFEKDHRSLGAQPLNNRGCENGPRARLARPPSVKSPELATETPHQPSICSCFISGGPAKTLFLSVQRCVTLNLR
jgi:hypothetical protein